MAYIPRRVEEGLKKSFNNNKVLFLLGARQVGKTTLIEYILKTHPGGLLNMDNQIHRSRVIEASKLEALEGLRLLTSTNTLVIDEAQRIPNIGRITKGWYDSHVPVKLVLLGSSVTALINLAASELVGRNEKLWLTPFLFEEILARQSWFNRRQSSDSLQQGFSQQIQALLTQRLVFGQYPEAYLSDNPRLYLENLVSDYLLKDIFTKSLVRSPDDVRRLLFELTHAIGQTVSVLQLATRLNLSRQTVQRYLDLLEGVSVIFKIPSYAIDPAHEITHSYKYYFWDNGIKNALQREWTISSARSDIEILWENWVIAEIMKLSRTFNRPEDLFFWRSRHGSSVELIVKQGSTLHPFNIKFHPHAAKPSRAFTNAYGQEPKIIHPGNVLEYLL